MYDLNIVINTSIKNLRNKEKIIVALEDGINRNVKRNKLDYTESSDFFTFTLKNVITSRNPTKIRRAFLTHLQNEKISNVFISVSGVEKTRWEIYAKQLGIAFGVIGTIGLVIGTTSFTLSFYPHP